ncbi:UspA domain protein [Natrialba chahannaoensis JCM 10990]|uniref:UspA domain protein n=1 Tax=Natrialba chahannaoensis JCM 10990 TaxID=1227492 RepID=M0AUZ5_9EURY|nr:universal stress protein [Natrialba chahannaoensis]ELZ01199.1 UspA domain protein [Natrialba chahannaoensis JCM 10990]
MTNSLIAQLVVPIANERDARATCVALDSVIDDGVETLTVVHVLEQTSGYPDKAPVEARATAAKSIFETVETWFQDGPEIHRELRYGIDVVDEIIATAEAVDASAIGFAHQPESRLKRLLSNTESYRLITESEQPVLVFSRVESADSDETQTDSEV